MDAYEELLARLGLLHLKEDPEALRLAILKELGLEEFRDDPIELNRRMNERLAENFERIEQVRSEVGGIIQNDILKRHN